MSLSQRFALAVALTLLPLGLIAQAPPSPDPGLRSLVLFGDSYPTGNAPLSSFFDPAHLNVIDRTAPTLTIRSAITSGAWSSVLAQLKPNDVVLFQFGPADLGAGATTPATSSLPGLNDDFHESQNSATGQPELVHTFGWYLREMVVETIARGAVPILCAPSMPQQPSGNSTSTGSAAWTQAIATQQRVPFLDLSRSDPSAEANATVAALRGLRPDPLEGYFSAKGTAVPPTAPSPAALPGPDPSSLHL